jgi:hypothetical protein
MIWLLLVAAVIAIYYLIARGGVQSLNAANKEKNHHGDSQESEHAHPEVGFEIVYFDAVKAQSALDNNLPGNRRIQC